MKVPRVHAIPQPSRPLIDGLIFLLQPHLQHMEVPRLAAESELQLQACATATEIPDPSPIFNLCGSLQQRQILNPLSEARDRNCILVDTMLGS